VKVFEGVAHECAGGDSGEELDRLVETARDDGDPSWPCNEQSSRRLPSNPSPPAARHSAAAPARALPNFFQDAAVGNITIVAMAKSKDKQPAKPESRAKSDKSVIKLDKKAFDPTLASLFATSVRAWLP
jgi:hypothetical protein